MNNDTNPATNPESVCQHCGKPVEFGMTQLGYRGFFHSDSKRVACKLEDLSPTVPLSRIDDEIRAGRIVNIPGVIR